MALKYVGKIKSATDQKGVKNGTCKRSIAVNFPVAFCAFINDADSAKNKYATLMHHFF